MYKTHRILRKPHYMDTARGTFVSRNRQTSAVVRTFRAVAGGINSLPGWKS
jgi:hypothetical protein